jgi:hypothetical protein
MSPKNQPELPSLNPLPYLLRETETGFGFETDFGLTYALTFTDDSAYIAESLSVNTVLSFSITSIVGEAKQKDPRVEVTIVQALLLTFDALPDAVITYICSLDNDQEVARSRLFQHWYRKVAMDRFIKLDYINQEHRIHTSVIFQHTHPDSEAIKSQFRSTFDK